MNSKSLSIITAALLSCTAFGNPPSTDPAISAPTEVAASAPATVKSVEGLKTKEDAKNRLSEKAKEMSSLRSKSTEAMTKLADIAKDPQYMASDDGIVALQDIASQLKEINERLKMLEEEIESIKGWIEGQNEALPILTNDVFNLNRWRNSSYMQFQYRNQTLGGAQQAGFRNRRIRIGAQSTVDAKTSIRYSFDLGTGTNQTAAQLRDAILIYDAEPSTDKVGLQFRFGQQPLQIGYELERSSGDREFPERSRYNGAMFDGERSTGVAMSYGFDEKLTLNAGYFNSLTYNDPEQRATGNDGTKKKYAGLVGLRHSDETLSIGLSTFWGHRPQFAVAKGTGANDPSNITAATIERQFSYLDITWLPKFLHGSFFRGELMWGRDRDNLGLASNSTNRNTAAAYNGVPMRGWHTVMGYNLDTRNQISFKMEEFDNNTRIDGNSVRGIGLGYQYWIGPTSKVGFFAEEFREPGRSFKVYTVRTTYRF